MKSGCTCRGNAGGFSLVEIAIALGIVAFALTAIVGLLSATLKTSKSALDDLLVSEMTSDLVNTLRKQDFTNIPSNATNVFFDISGKRVNPLDPTTGVISNVATALAIQQGAVYSCAPTIRSDTNLEGTNSFPNLWRITLAFQWPAGAASSLNQKNIHAEIARY
ncbi:hypothetical protein BH09VER1_BH09VER1_27480 [soil metagenome]